MKDLIIKALNEVFESVTKSTPKVKTNEEFFDADECSITDLQQIIKNNNLPQDICLELWHPENDNGNWCYDGDGYPIDALGFVKRSKSPTTDKEQLKYKTTEMRTKAWSTIKYSLLSSGYTFSNYYLNDLHMYSGDPTNKIDTYDLYINKKWDELIEYYSKYYKKMK